MLCGEGQRLRDNLADASARFSDYPEPGVKQMPERDRLKAEQLHIEQQEALTAFAKHVETCSVCDEERS
jgi:hypothetical protein